ncbi:hypothetical protein CcaverHIS002_0104010 [Cutaneotrichosporon cavernicola]|uniref:DNA-directed RNA polymerase I subunit RPA34.5 n=1 Tax=Cutaneotrichosporon cavernicola TaxID=279322 RepID=A0AA48IBB0_9TREE|nr:uncharacterized protein CcaverHIS019_0103940 [Cutaneotrichosporon cavernicola]BEI79872.1 hypothetical protein CcaverHIS002_0104010 [Cutaneotrichosporon cavernicola]BEI87676.1 hypothetical protein CcaverHIS019_0103940 [Cutaneotrichosporon cavernicola]BEI95448.1 hypothetical protein CcaverHIS631_0103970 [Cutaneotrichosporon cavernicola]BEJ03223.1 hypothetical protein CcaverHIS641_0103980 [Cutaneotrichosporon cavernicola]
MSAKAGPSKRSVPPKKKTKPAMIVDEASEASQSDSESVNSDNIDEPIVETPRPTQKVRKGAPLPLYQAPIGMEPVQVSTSFKNSPFEFDALNKKGVELWAIRVPADFKASRLASLALDKPGKSVRGRLERSGTSYTLQTAEKDEGIGAEMTGMSLLVPNLGRAGHLQRAPIKISRRLILAPADDKADGTEFTAPPKVKRTQPEGKLKFRNRAFGFDTPGPGATMTTVEETAVAEVEEAKEDEDDDDDGVPESPAKSKSPKKEKKDRKEKESKKDKKRKAEDETPKKKKKAKAE